MVGGLLAGAAFAAAQRPVEPGGEIGAMRVVSGELYNASEDWFAVCTSHVSRPGTYHWSCSLPKVPRLYIGAGDVAPTQAEIDSRWKHERWSLWVDGRRVDLPRFGVSDSPISSNGRPAVLKKWKVILVNAPSGKHTIRYLEKVSGAAYDGTWVVTVEK
jgi:hypothetical protein